MPHYSFEAIWHSLDYAKKRGFPTPAITVINSLLRKNSIPLMLDPPYLRLSVVDSTVDGSENRQDIARGHVYSIGEELGSGGFGVVYRVARETSIGPLEFAMKVLNPSQFNSRPERAATRFQREIEVLKRLQHKGIVPYVDAGIGHDERPFFVMPIIEGNDLYTSLRGRGVDEILLAFEEIARTIAYAHGKGVVHRDLKPSNVLIRSSDQQPIILDFGCAFLMDDSNEQSLTTTLLGSVGYMHPQVMQDPKCRDERLDVYAIAVMLYELLADTKPVFGEYGELPTANCDCKGLDSLLRAALLPINSSISADEFLVRLCEFRRSGRDVTSYDVDGAQLDDHAATTLGLIVELTTFSEQPPSYDSIASEVDADFTPFKLNMAIRLLKKQRMIEVETVELRSWNYSDEYEGVRIQERGYQWIEGNRTRVEDLLAKLDRNQSGKDRANEQPPQDDDIPF